MQRQNFDCVREMLTQQVKFIQVQLQNLNCVRVMLTQQMKLIQVESEKRSLMLAEQLKQMYCERDKDRTDKDKERIANWSHGQQTLAMALSMNTGTC